MGSYDSLPVLQITSGSDAREWVKKVRQETDIRIVFQLKEKGYSNEAIADIMDISEKTVSEFNKEIETRVRRK